MPIYKVNGAKNKDGLQKYNVRVNYVSNIDGTPKQLTRTTYGYESAKDLERKLLNEIKTLGGNSVRKITIQQLFDEYINAMKYELRETSLDKNERNYYLYVEKTMGNVMLHKITVSLLQNWKLSVEEKKLALKTRQHAYSIFRSVLNYAVKMEYLPTNPLLRVGNFKEALSLKPDMKIYNAQEFTLYINTAKQLAEEHEEKHHNLSYWDFYVFFNIAFYTGLRKGEIYALKWSDINGAFLSVKRSVTQKLKGGDRETAPKNKSSIRTLQLPLPLILVLEEHKKRQEKMEHFSDDYRICGGVRPIRDSTVNNRNKLFAEHAGLDRIRIHDFRHSHVSILANERINIQEIARRLGHSKIEETWNTYSHMYPREEERAVDVLNGIAA